MDFSLTTLFVVPTAKTLATTGGTDALTDGQLGVYINDLKTAAATGTIPGKFFQIAQGRNAVESVTLGSKKSGKYRKDTVTEWYKVDPAQGNGTTIVTMTDFTNIKCNQFYALTLMFSSFYTNIMHFGGKVQSVFAETPCCECGDDPCDTLSDADLGTFLTGLVAQANAKWGEYATFALSGSGVADYTITITSVALDTFETSCVIMPEMIYDEMLIVPYFYKGAETSQDFIFESTKCDSGVTVAVTQRATYSFGKKANIKKMEIDYFKYQHNFKFMSYDDPNLNRHITSYADGDNYTLYVIKGKNTSSNETWASYVHTDQMVIVAFPSGHASMAGFETLLTAELGACKDLNP